MTTAPHAQQRQLLTLQAHDNRLAKLRHERRTLPVLSQIEETVKELTANKRARIMADAALADARTQAADAENSVQQVVTRAQVLRERLSSGTVGARDLPHLQAEIDQLGQRQSVLEDEQLAAIEQLDRCTDTASTLEREETSIRERGRELTATRDAEFARIDALLEEAQKERDELAQTIQPSLLNEYETIRRETGGLGAVGLYQGRIEGPIEISPQELARIRTARPDELVYSEENGVIIVRMDD